LDSRILDASAFYAGIPFRSQMECYTTPQVYDEIKHIKKNHDALGILIETKRLKIIDPDSKYIDLVIKMAEVTGDFRNLSKEDISSIALCLQLNGEILTDDFAISNVAVSLGLKVIPLMTEGIKDKGSWIYYCPGCHRNFSKSAECPFCGNILRKKLLKDKSSVPLNK
jgi:endoribonuclease Nob1